MAPSAQNRSKVASTAPSGSQPTRSTLFTTKMGRSPSASAFRVTKRVWGIGPSKASTSRQTQSTIFSTRSTSPPKSAWPGVSTMLMRVPFQVMAVNLERMVMPRSRSRSFESIAQSAMTSPVRNCPACRRKPSTSVVLPWSTCAMMAMLRTSRRTAFSGEAASVGTGGAEAVIWGAGVLGPGPGRKSGGRAGVATRPRVNR